MTQMPPTTLLTGAIRSCFAPSSEASIGGAGAVVSFAGAPLLQPGDAGRVSAAHPPVLVVATMTLGTVPGVASDRLLLANPLQAKIIQLAIADASDPAGPKAAKGDVTGELFAQNYRILRPAN